MFNKVNQSLFLHQDDLTQLDATKKVNNDNLNRQLHHACQQGNFDEAKVLIFQGAIPGLNNKDRRHELHYAIDYCEGFADIQLMKLLIARLRINGSNTVNFVNKSGKYGTPLMSACQQAYEEVVYLLLSLDESTQFSKKSYQLENINSALYQICSAPVDKLATNRIIIALLNFGIKITADLTSFSSRNFLLNIIRQMPQIMEQISQSYQLPTEFILAAIRKNHNAIGFIANDITITPKMILTALYQGEIPKEIIPSKRLTFRAINNLHSQSKHAARNLAQICLVSKHRDSLLTRLVEQIVRYENRSPQKAKKVITALANLCDSEDWDLIKKNIITAIQDNNSPLYKALNTHSNPIPITFLGPSIWPSTKTVGLLEIESAIIADDTYLNNLLTYTSSCY